MAHIEHLRYLRMGVMSGLIALRSYLHRHEDSRPTDAVRAIQTLYFDEAHFDYEVALELHERLALTPNLVRDQIVRATLDYVTDSLSPWWLQLAANGRERLKAALTGDEIQCFEAAGLFTNPITEESQIWWDQLAARGRGLVDAAKVAQGRRAEQLTLCYEAERLQQLGIKQQPQWVALDDNGAGYDIQSFDPGPNDAVVRLIEVKSCAGSPLQIYLTRNEWDAALTRGPHYFFYVWSMPDERLALQLTPAQIEPHVPTNRGRGAWENVRIVLAG